MDVVDVVLADYATIDNRGKFTAVGAGFTDIRTRVLPCVHPLMFLILRLKISKEDVGGHRIGIQIVGEKGRILKADLNLNIGDNQVDKKVISLTARFEHTKFEGAGIYNIDILVNTEIRYCQNLTITHEPKQNL